VKNEIAVAKKKANIRVMPVIRIADRFADKKMNIGTKRRAVDAIAMMTLIKIPSLKTE